MLCVKPRDLLFGLVFAILAGLSVVAVSQPVCNEQQMVPKSNCATEGSLCDQRYDEEVCTGSYAQYPYQGYWECTGGGYDDHCISAAQDANCYGN